MLHKLHIRLTVICTCITALILAGMACGCYLFARSQLTQQADASFQRDVNAVLLYLKSQTLLDHGWLSQTQANGGMTLWIEDNGIPLAYPKIAEEEKRTQLLAQAQKTAQELYSFDFAASGAARYQAATIFFTMASGSEEYSVCLATISLPNEKQLEITVLKSKAPLYDQLRVLLIVFSGLVLLAAAFLGIFAWFFTARAIKPVAESQRQQNQFVSAASHELRSPLAVIQASISAMEGSSPEQARRFATAITQECCQMSRLVEDMLSLARVDSGAWTIHPAATDLETLLLDTAEWFEPILAKKNIAIRTELPDEVVPSCLCDSSRISQVLHILLDNASSYVQEGGKVLLTIRQQKGTVQLIVADNGPGIAKEDREKIFQRFYRGDPSRSHREHCGLGLCVAREIALLHKGSLTVSDTLGGGSTFTLSLPLK